VVVVTGDAVGTERDDDLRSDLLEHAPHLRHELAAGDRVHAAVRMPEEPQVGFEPQGIPRGEVLGLPDPCEGLAGRKGGVGDATGIATRRQDHGELELVVRVEREAASHAERLVVGMREDARDPSHRATAAAGGRAAARARS
jgi:hypothetical protein